MNRRSFLRTLAAAGLAACAQAWPAETKVRPLRTEAMSDRNYFIVRDRYQGWKPNTIRCDSDAPKASMGVHDGLTWKFYGGDFSNR